MDLRHLLAHEVAAGIIATGIEGAYDSVSAAPPAITRAWE